jgi:hypothetical protein
MWEVTVEGLLSPVDADGIRQALEGRMSQLGRCRVAVTQPDAQRFRVGTFCWRLLEADLPWVLTARGSYELLLVESESGEPPPPVTGADVVLPSPDDASERLALSRAPELGAFVIEEASSRPCERNAALYCLYVRLTPESGAALERFSRSHVGGRVALVVDGAIVAAPVIRDPMSSLFTVSLAGSVPLARARALAAILQGGTFPRKLRMTARLLDPRDAARPQ